MKHVVKLSVIASSCGLGLFLSGCDNSIDCDKVFPKQEQDECRQKEYRSQNNINTTSSGSSHSSGFFAPVNTYNSSHGSFGS